MNINNITLSHENSFNNKSIIINDYIEIILIEHVNKHDTINSIANSYYDKNIYDKRYNNIEEYIKSIISINNIELPLTPFQDINIPVLVHKNNVYIERISKIEKNIHELEKWVLYTVNNGDTLDSLAYNSSGDSNDAYNNKLEIIDYNNLINSNLIVGDKIYIINPDIGILKREISHLKHKLKHSLKITDISN